MITDKGNYYQKIYNLTPRKKSSKKNTDDNVFRSYSDFCAHVHVESENMTYSEFRAERVRENVRAKLETIFSSIFFFCFLLSVSRYEAWTRKTTRLCQRNPNRQR